MPLPKGFREWLAKESEGWSVDGLISPDQRARILGRYPEDETPSGRMAFVLRAFGVLLFGAAVMLVIGHNWADLPRGGRTLFESNGMTIVFDDCDSILKDEVARNLLTLKQPY